MNMEQIVSITSRGQLTIPKGLRDIFGVQGAVKALIRKEGETLVVVPKRSFHSLAGSMRSTVKLSNAELRKARSAFGKSWPRPQ